MMDTTLMVVIMLAFIRTGFFIFLIPAWNHQTIPVLAKVFFALLLAYIFAGVIRLDTVDLPQNYGDFFVFGVREAYLGLLMGFAVRLAFAFFSFGSHHIAMEMGLMMSQTLNPGEEGGNKNTVEVVFHAFAVLLFFVLGLHHYVIAAFGKSFHIAPVGFPEMHGVPVAEIIRESAGILFVGVQIAAPFMAVMFLINMSFAVLGKVAPQVNVFMISFSVRIGMGFLVILMGTGIITRIMSHYLGRTPDTMLQFLAP